MFYMMSLLLHQCQRSKTRQKADKNSVLHALDLNCRFSPLQRNPASGSRRKTLIHMLRHTAWLCPTAVPHLDEAYINDVGDGITSRTCLFADDTNFYSVIRTPTSTNSTQLQVDFRKLESRDSFSNISSNDNTWT